MRKEQLLEPLALLERGLHPEVTGPRQDTFREREDAFYVEFFELAGVTLDPDGVSSSRSFQLVA